MPQRIKIKINDIHKKDDLYTKYASIKVGSRNYIPLFPTINPHRVRYNTLRNLTSPIPIENYIIITLDKLRAMDSDQAKQRAFIAEKLDNIVGSTTMFITKLLIKEGQKISDKDVDYLVDLLNFPSNDIMIPPLVYHYITTNPSNLFPNGRDMPTKGIVFDSYLPFLKLFLSKATQRKIESFAFTLPNNSSYADLEKLLGAYKDYETQIAVIDSKGSKMSQLSPQISRLTSRDEKLYTLPEKNNEGFVLYSFDSVPYTAHQRDMAPAENILQYFSGFSWFGPRHTINMKGPIIPKPPLPPRLYKSDNYSYIKHTSDVYAAAKKDFDAWYDSNYNGIKAKDKLVSYKKDYEIVGLAKSVDNLYNNITNDKFFQGIATQPHLSDAIKRIRSMNKKDLKI